MSDETNVEEYIKNKEYNRLEGYIGKHKSEFTELAHNGNARAAGLFARYCLENKENSKVETVYYYELAKRNAKLNSSSTEGKDFYDKDGDIEEKLENLRNELTAEEKYKLAVNYYIPEFTNAKDDEVVRGSKEKCRKDLISLLKQASEEGYAEASYKLAELYEHENENESTILKGSTTQAVYYYNRALADGLKETNNITTAEKKINELINKVSTREKLENLIGEYQEDVSDFQKIEKKYNKLSGKG